MAPSPNRRPGGVSTTARRGAGTRPHLADTRPGRRDPSSGPRQSVRPTPGPNVAGATRAPRPAAGPFARRSTRRLAVLGSVFVLLAIMLVPTFRQVLMQRSELSSLSDQVARQRTEVSALQAQQQKWNDPTYVEAQARERLKFVKPGEKSFTVIGADKLLGDPMQGRAAVVTPAEGDATVPWYGKMWSSLVATDHLETDAATAPLTPVGDAARQATPNPSTDPATDGEPEPGSSVGSADGSGVTLP